MKTTTIRLPAGRWCPEVLVGVELADRVDSGVVELENDAGEFELDAAPPPPQPLANATSTAIVTLTRIASSLDEDDWQPLSLVQSTFSGRRAGVGLIAPWPLCNR
jgi:hypothetical protein